MGGNALAAAVGIIGGQAQLARILGVSQPNVWHWLHKSEHVPAEYVLKIEQATGGKVSRHDLRPDIYPPSMSRPKDDAAMPATVAEEDRMRADCYRLLGRLLAAPPSGESLDAVGRMLGGQGEFGAAVDALAAAARSTGEEAALREYNDLFIGLARADMERLGIAPSENNSDPEDHIAALAEMMAGLITGAFGAPAPLAEQKKFFDAHLAPWAGRLFADLERAEGARFYKPVGTIGRLFLAIEAEAFLLMT